MTKWSQGFFNTTRELPSDAELMSHQLLIKGGYIKKLSQGIFTYGNLALRALGKIESVIRKELEALSCQEILMPMVQPKKIWEASGRWNIPELQKLTHKNSSEACLGATHEEVICDYVKNDLKSYKSLPFSLFQVQSKFRDEIRPRYGLMRGREFIMKDAYSFDQTQEEAFESYEKFKQAYVQIFTKLGLDFRVVKADSGNIGGNLSEEFQLLADVGEDQLLISDQGDYAANVEICPCLEEPTEAEFSAGELEEFATPDIKSIESLAQFLSVDTKLLVKTLFFESINKDGTQKTFAVLMRGLDEVNPVKLKNKLGLNEVPRLMEASEVFKLTGTTPGSCGPQALDLEVFADQNLKNFKSMIVGANKDGFHVRNLTPGRDFKIKSFDDFRKAVAGLPSPDGKGVLQEIKGIEVGHIFYLGQKYSESLGVKFQNAEGKMQAVEMGCYGIGVGRTLQAAIEQNHDKNGICWPKNISPFDVHICLLDPKSEELQGYLSTLSAELEAQGLSVFVDDRDERPGVKFKDADLLGFSLRVNLGQRGFDQGEIDFVCRQTGEKKSCSVKELSSELFKSYQDLN